MQSDDQPTYSAHSCHHDLDSQSSFFPSLYATIFLQEICAHVGCGLRREFRQQLSEVAKYDYAQYP